MTNNHNRLEILFRRLKNLQSILSRITNAENLLNAFMQSESGESLHSDDSAERMKGILITLEELDEIIYRAEVEVDIMEDRITALQEVES
ncbi:MAG: hypothetical protein GF411_09855 [Candidatus Lokiarchaeota archaeon]|nr:hypothetical protein [Candidatus Lokiarchaeota archaeon]